MTGRTRRKTTARQIHLFWKRDDSVTLRDMRWSEQMVKEELVAMLQRADLSPMDLLRSWDSSGDATFSRRDFMVMMKKLLYSHGVEHTASLGRDRSQPNQSWKDETNAEGGEESLRTHVDVLGQEMEAAATKVQATWRGSSVRTHRHMIDKGEAEKLWYATIKPLLNLIFDDLSGDDGDMQVDKLARWLNDEWREQRVRQRSGIQHKGMPAGARPEVQIDETSACREKAEMAEAELAAVEECQQISSTDLMGGVEYGDYISLMSKQWDLPDSSVHAQLVARALSLNASVADMRTLGRLRRAVEMSKSAARPKDSTVGKASSSSNTPSTAAICIPNRQTRVPVISTSPTFHPQGQNRPQAQNRSASAGPMAIRQCVEGLQEAVNSMLGISDSALPAKNLKPGSFGHDSALLPKPALLHPSRPASPISRPRSAPSLATIKATRVTSQRLGSIHSDSLPRCRPATAAPRVTQKFGAPPQWLSTFSGVVDIYEGEQSPSSARFSQGFCPSPMPIMNAARQTSLRKMSTEPAATQPWLPPRVQSGQRRAPAIKPAADRPLPPSWKWSVGPIVVHRRPPSATSD